VSAQETNLKFTPVRAEPYVVVMPAEHRLARRTSVTWKALANERLVSVSPSSGNRLLIDNAFANIEKRPTIHYEINHVTGAINLVAAGLGVAIVPGLALSRLLHPGLRGVPLVNPSATRTLGLITRKGDRLHDVAQSLADSLVAAMQAPLTPDGVMPWPPRRR